MAALPAGALPGAGAKPTGTHAQGGGLQPQTAGGHLGTAQRIANASLKKINERMKPKNLDDLDGHQSIFAAPRCRCVRSISKTTPFADISFSVARSPVSSTRFAPFECRIVTAEPATWLIPVRTLTASRQSPAARQLPRRFCWSSASGPTKATVPDFFNGR